MNETLQLALLMLAALGVPLALAGAAHWLRPAVDWSGLGEAIPVEPVPDAGFDTRSTPDQTREAPREVLPHRLPLARAGETCGACRYYEASSEGRARAGICRRHTPFAPVQAKVDWCGEFSR